MPTYDWTYIDPIIKAVFPANGMQKVHTAIYQLQGKCPSIRIIRNRARYIKVHRHTKKLSLLESDQFIRNYYSNNAADYCAKHTGRTRQYIIHRASTLKVRLNPELVAHKACFKKTKSTLPKLERLALGLPV